MHPILAAFPPLDQGCVCLLGVGNRLRGDDGAGPMLIEQLRDRVPVQCIDGGVAPENYLGKIARLRPETVIIIDAVNFGGEPGKVRVLSPEQIGGGNFSTHAPALKLVCDYLRNDLAPTMIIIGIQPRQTDFNTPPSVQVQAAVRGLAAALEEAFRAHA
jgi:hydrogenase 3 maturation protease